MCNIWSCPKRAQWSGCVQTQRIMVWPVDSPKGQSAGRGLITWWVLLLADLVRDAGLLNICTTFKLWCFDGWIRVDLQTGRSTLDKPYSRYDWGMLCLNSSLGKTASTWNTRVYLFLIYLDVIIVIKIWPQTWWLFKWTFLWLKPTEQSPPTWSRGFETKKTWKSNHTMLHCFENYRPVDKMLIMNGNLIPDMYVMTICETALIHILCHNRVYGKSKWDHTKANFTWAPFVQCLNAVWLWYRL